MPETKLQVASHLCSIVHYSCSSTSATLLDPAVFWHFEFVRGKSQYWRRHVSGLCQLVQLSWVPAAKGSGSCITPSLKHE